MIKIGPTSASKPTSSPWRARIANTGKSPIEPRYLRDSSWRSKASSSASSPKTPGYLKSSCNKDKSKHQHSSSQPSWTTSEPHTNPQTSISPWSSIFLKESARSPIAPWSGTAMSSRPGESIAEQLDRISDLTCIAGQDQGNARPTLQIRIPENTVASEESSTLRPRLGLTDGGPTLLNAAALDFVPQQSSQSSARQSSNTDDPPPFSERSAAVMDLPVFASLTDGLHRESSTQIDEKSPADEPSVQGASRTNAGVDIGEPQIDQQVLPSSSPTLANQSSSTERGPPLSEAMSQANATPATPTSHSNTALHESQPSQTLLIRRRAPALVIEAPTPESAWPTGPRHPARRQPNARSAGFSRRLLLTPNRQVTHTNSRTWVHPRTQLQARWAGVYKNLKDMSLIKEGHQSPVSPLTIVGGSFCVPKTLNEWVEHRTEFANDRAKEARQRLYAMQEHRLLPRHPDLPPPGEIAPVSIAPFGGRQFRDGRSSVLAMDTIWSPWRPVRAEGASGFRMERAQVLWPCPEEMKEEGNERNTSQYRRFLALPRVPGNPTVNWKQKRVLPMLPFDEVWKLPSRETYYDQRAVTTSEERQEMEAMIGHDLLTAIDCDLDNIYQDEG